MRCGSEVPKTCELAEACFWCAVTVRQCAVDEVLDASQVSFRRFGFGFAGNQL